MKLLRADNTEVKKDDIVTDKHGYEYTFCWLGDEPAPGVARRAFVRNKGVSCSFEPQFLGLKVSE